MAARSRLFKRRQAARHRQIFFERLEPRTLLAFDFGDAPDIGAGTGIGNYETLLANDGPRHDISTTQTTLYLGARVDGEADATQGGRANGDDITTLPDDEDGLVEPALDLVLTIGSAPTVRVQATNTTGSLATLYGWIDYNRDGVFDNATERSVVPFPPGLTKGTFTLVFPAIPLGTPAGATYARFRFSADAAAANPTGAASGGEVEDYLAAIVRRSDGTADNTKNKKIASGTNGGPTLADYDAFGGSVAALCDLDGDGVSDLAVGANRDNTGGTDRGAVHVLLMNANGTVKSSVKIGSGLNGGPTLANSDFFGISMAALGDLDGDGVNELAVGADRDDTGGTDRGAVYVLLLNSDGTAKSSVKIASGINGGPTLADNDLFGFSVTELGDLDGDGVTDLAVGASGDSTGGMYRGAVHVLLMKSDGTVKSSVKIASGTNGGPTLSDFDLFGRSVATLGDLNGDGVTDLAVGATGDDTGGTGAAANRGAVHVLLLNANGTVKSALSVKIASGTNGAPTLADGDFFGISVTALGDLDGDGVTDLAVGAFGDATGGPARGAVHVLLLKADGTVKSSVKIASGTNGAPTLADGDYFGRSLAALGDLDGDGVTDLAVGAFSDDTGGPSRGAVHVLFLKALPAFDFGDAPDAGAGTGIGNYETLLASGGPSHVIDTTQATLFLGARVDNEADAAPNARANGDDIATLPDDEDGLVEPAQDLTLTVGSAPTVRVRATNTTASPATLYGWIDVNRDGFFDNASERTSVTIPIGTIKGTFTLVFPTIPLGTPAGATYARFRLSGDAAAANPTGAASGGEVEDYPAAIVRRSDGTADSTKTKKIASGTNGVPTLGDYANFGSSVASLGDLDGDGVTDLAVGGRDDVPGLRGAVRVLMMKADGTVKSSVKIASGLNGGPTLADGDLFGSSVASLGDLDGDGVTDLAVGATGDFTGGHYDSGAVHVLLLKSDGTVKSSVKIASGTNGGPTLSGYEFFGRSVAALGDLDGDGVTDLMVGASGSFDGAAYVLFLKADGRVKSTVKRAGGNHFDFFGISVAAVGDLDRDGVTDVVVGAVGDDTGGTGADPNLGAVHVLMMKSDGTVKSSVKIASGLNGGPALADGDQFGRSLAALGDLDGDGVTDLAVGADRGEVHVLMMKSDGTVKSSVTIASGIGGGPMLADNDHFGRSVAALGDLDGDGVTDLAVGAVGDNTGGPSRGAVHVLFLKAPSIWHSTKLWTNGMSGLDVTNDNHVAANDAVAVINYINAFGSFLNGKVPALASSVGGQTASYGGPFGYIDVNGDGFVAANDAVAIINVINAGQGGEGELANQDDDLMTLLAIDFASRPKRR